MAEGYETSDSAKVIRRWFEEVWNKGREEAIGVLRLEGIGGSTPGPDDALPSLD